MKAIIIEDEQLAANRLSNMIKSYDSSIEIVAIMESVEDSVAWFRNNPHPDLMFLDIHLEDGISFSIFDQVQVDIPVIFTTAFDEYAIKAFKLKSVDYLLKPITSEDLAKAITKYKNWSGKDNPQIDLRELYSLISGTANSYRERFSVTVGERLKSIEVNDIAYFFSTCGITFLVPKTKGQYSLEMSLDKLSNELNPKDFFRINRQYLVHHKAIANVLVYPKSKLMVELNPPAQEDVSVSLDKVSDFKKWLDGVK